MHTILHIEDNPANRTLLDRVLRNSNYRLIHAVDGESGILTATQEKPDLILLDIGLPDVDGQTVVAMLRQIPELDKTPVVAITAWPPDTADEMTARYGFDGCITKPISVAQFPRQIAAFLTPA